MTRTWQYTVGLLFWSFKTPVPWTDDGQAYTCRLSLQSHNSSQPRNGPVNDSLHHPKQRQSNPDKDPKQLSQVLTPVSRGQYASGRLWTSRDTSWHVLSRASGVKLPLVFYTYPTRFQGMAFLGVLQCMTWLRSFNLGQRVET